MCLNQYCWVHDLLVLRQPVSENCVDMHVPRAGYHKLAATIDHLCTLQRLRLCTGSHSRDAIACDHNRHVAKQGTVIHIDDCCVVDDERLFCGQRRGCCASDHQRAQQRARQPTQRSTQICLQQRQLEGTRFHWSRIIRTPASLEDGITESRPDRTGVGIRGCDNGSTNSVVVTSIQHESGTLACWRAWVCVLLKA